MFREWCPHVARICIDQYVYYRDDKEWEQSIALSKNDFADNVLEKVEGFDSFNMENFKLILDVIQEILDGPEK